MSKFKHRVLYNYLFMSFLALVAVANHFNFESYSASDAFVSEYHEGADFTTLEGLSQAESPAIATDFAKLELKKSANVSETANVLRLPAASRVQNPAVDAGNGVKVFENMLYAHSTRAGAAFKRLEVGSLFEATIDGQSATYRVVSREVYSRDYLNDNDSLRASIYTYGDGISLMTCGDGSNNDESSRLVLLAVAV